LTSCDFSRHTT